MKRKREKEIESERECFTVRLHRKFRNRLIDNIFPKGRRKKMCFSAGCRLSKHQFLFKNLVFFKISKFQQYLCRIMVQNKPVPFFLVIGLPIPEIQPPEVVLEL
jgi:hypothetical protein